MGISATSTKQKFRATDNNAGFTLIEVLVYLACLILLTMVMINHWMHLQRFSLGIKKHTLMQQHTLMIQQWLSQARENAGFLGCRRNDETFRLTQSVETQNFLLQHPAIRQYHYITGSWQPYDVHTNNYYMSFNKKLSESLDPKHDVLEVQYLKIMPWIIHTRKLHSFEVVTNHAYHPQLPLIITDCKTFKVIAAAGFESINPSSTRLLIKDYPPYIDPNFMLIGQWQDLLYYFDRSQSFYIKERQGRKQRLLRQ